MGAGRLADHRLRARVVVIQRLGREAELVAMPASVDRDAVARGGDLSGERARPLDLLADEEERRLCTGTRQRLQNRSGPLCVRAVVERDCHAVAARHPAGDTQRVRHRRGDWRECG